VSGGFPWGSVISGGASIAGGLLGRSKGRSRQSAREGAVEDARYFYHTVTKEAPKYGIHPLYAMGHTPNYTPSATVGDKSSLGAGLAAAGQDIGNAISKKLDTQSKRLIEANIELTKQKAATEATLQGYYASKSAQTRNAHNSSKSEVSVIPYDEGRKVKVENLEDYYDSAVIQKDNQISKASTFPSSTSGTHAGLKEYDNPLNGKKIMLPYSEEGPAEALESTPFWMLPAIYEANRKRYGKNWDSGLVDTYKKQFKRALPKGSRIRSMKEIKHLLQNKGSRRSTRGTYR
jgi:hypothetical protein